MLKNLGINAKKASRILMCASSQQKNEALKQIAVELINNSEYIINENKKDLAGLKALPMLLKKSSITMTP